MDLSFDRGESWFNSIYLAHYPAIVRYGLRRTADPAAADELAQEVFVVAWRRRAEVPDRSLPWLYGVARRLLANRWRAHRGNPEFLSLHEAEVPRRGATPTAQDSVIELAGIRAALAGLPEADQEILRLVAWEDLSVSDVARVLGCTRGTAAVRLHRARRRLAAALEAPSRPYPTPVAARG